MDPPGSLLGDCGVTLGGSPDMTAQPIIIDCVMGACF